MTKKEFSKKCREIMASTHLTEKGKAVEIERTATKFVEDNIGSFPEIQSIEKRRTAIEEKYGGPDGIRYCPECSTWSPKEPPIINTLGREWVGIFGRKVDELCRKVLASKVE